ncbi:RICIN domain-containing protein [Bacillus toyonensis]|uniref:RICIN domain-containing protein n=2 Tax=Bacillus toyonensis TaxID=155322 RepID=UPI001155AE2D|nr:hypothetical protein [Bacillus toyonensis]
MSMYYYNYVPYYLPFQMYTYIHRNAQSANVYDCYPIYFDNNYNSGYYERYNSTLNRYGIISLQNNANTHWKDWYLDIDGHSGKLILWDRPGSGNRWRVINHGNNVVSLQNTANTPWKNWYLDIDGHSGKVILWDRLSGGGYWKLTEQGHGLVSLQNTENTPWKDWYLDINGHTGEIILEKNLGSGGYWRLSEVEDSKQFPIRGFEHTELGDHRRMETSIIVSKNGRIDGTTKTWTAHHTRGFHGSVMVVLLDGPPHIGNVVYATKPQRYGVNPKSKRTDFWFEVVPQDVLNQVTHYAITHAVTPLPTLTPAKFKEWSDIVVPIVKEFTQDSPSP